jgi:hypothetical protein
LGNQWIEVENAMGSPDGQFILLPNNENKVGAIFPIKPHILDLKESISLRVIVTGVLEDDPHQMVGAYSDLILKP